MVFTCQFALAQSGQYVRKTKETTVVHYAEDQSHAIVNGVKTSNNVMYLFKPDEIVLRRVHSENVSMHVLVFGIEVKNSNHPVLKYFEHQAKLKIRNKYFEHNTLPKINPAQVASLAFHKGDDQSASYLEVTLLDPENTPKQQYKYGTVTEKSQYYDVDGRIVDTSTTPLPMLRKGSFTSETLCCKEAYEKYHDLRFIKGIQVMCSN
ncbi:hypothetical protein GCM10027293_26970 [Pontibacter aydingkolensis]